MDKNFIPDCIDIALGYIVSCRNCDDQSCIYLLRLSNIQSGLSYIR